MTSPVDRVSIHGELDRAGAEFRDLVASASPSALDRRTDGTRWTNQQMLFHMLFGYLIVHRLLGLVRTMSRLPDGVGRVFAGILNAGTWPFHVINYLGSCAGGAVLRGHRLSATMDRTVASLHRRLDAESEQALSRGMHFPPAWDPYFAGVMSLAEVYRYGTRHFDHHRRQLTIASPAQEQQGRSDQLPG